MSILAALTRAYDRLPNVAPYGFSPEKISYCIILNLDGSVASIEDLRNTDRKRSPAILNVPQAVKRTVGVSPNFLWDKSSYVLGVSALPASEPSPENKEDEKARKRAAEKKAKRTAAEHACFKEKHAECLSQSTDPGLIAVLRFLQNWQPEDFVAPLWSDEMRDQSIVFALVDEYRDRKINERPAAKDLWEEIGNSSDGETKTCLVTGNIATVARLHPSIKGVWGAQSSGASLVSFNLDAFTSYGHSQGDNAPISEAAAFKHTTALNFFLAPTSKNRVQLGDASTVFWADGSALDAEKAESYFSAYTDGSQPSFDNDKIQSEIIASHLERIRRGEALVNVEPKLAENVRFHVLGLSPNAARLSVRFYWEDSFGALTKNYQKHWADSAVEPPPKDGWAPLWRSLLELAVQNKRENIPPNLAGDWMRAILTGGPYPATLLSRILMRIRADGEVNALRASILKSILIRNFNKEAPVALDPEFKDSKGYLLGRLFAAYEQVQYAAQGGNVNATIKDKFFGAASASPQKVFGVLASGAQNHFGKLRKSKTYQGRDLETLIMSIMDQMSPNNDPIPAFLPPTEQALFGLGYYHQRSKFFPKSENTTDTASELTE